MSNPRASHQVTSWFIVALWALAIGAGILDLVYVLDTWWMGSDFQYIVLSVVALFHHRPVSRAFVYPPGMLILASPMIVLQHGRRAEDLLLIFEVLGLAYTFRTMWRLIDRSLFSVAAAGLALALAVSGQVIYVFQLENLTLMLLPFVAGLYSLMVTRHWLGAGLVLGVSLTIKPMLAPLLILLLLEKQWKAVAVAIGLPAVTSAVVLAVSAQRGRFLSQALNVLSGNNHAGGINLSGIGELWNVNGSVIVVARVLVVLATAVVVQRIWTGEESRTLRYVWFGETLLAGLFLVFEFTHSFYTLLLLPAFVVSLVAGRPSTRWLALVGTALILLPVQLAWIGTWPESRPQATLQCVGMLFMLAAAATVGGRTADSEPAASSRELGVSRPIPSNEPLPSRDF